MANPDVVLNTNFMGAKRVTEAFLDLMDPTCGRIVNISSSAGPMWLYNQDEITREKFTNTDTALEDLIQTVEENKTVKNYQMGNGYDLSKAGLNALSIIQG